MKQAVDNVLCSICHLRPEFFMQILQWIGVVADMSPADIAASGMTQSATDDAKDSEQNQPLTDDVKADSGVTGSRRATSLHSTSFNVNTLNECQLSTLAVSCQSPVALRRLIDTGIVSSLCAGLCAASQRKLCTVFDMEPLVSTSESFVSTDAGKVWADLNCAGSSLNSHRQSTSSEQTSPLLNHAG